MIEEPPPDPALAGQAPPKEEAILSQRRLIWRNIIK